MGLNMSLGLRRWNISLTKLFPHSPRLLLALLALCLCASPAISSFERQECFDYGPSNPVVGWHFFEDRFEEVVIREGILFLVGDVIELFDPSSATNLINIGSIDIYGLDTRWIKFDEDRAYIQTYDGLLIFDVSDPINSIFIGLFETLQSYFLCCKGNLVFTAEENNRFCVYDITDPQAVHLVDDMEFDGPVEGLALFDHYAIMGVNGEGIRVVDIENPDELVVVSEWDCDFNPCHMKIHDSFLFFDGLPGGVHLFDLSDPYDLSYHGVIAEPSGNFMMTDDKLFIASDEGLYVYSIEDLPEIDFDYLIPHCSNSNQLSVENDIVYLFDRPRSLMIVDSSIDPSQDEPISSTSTENILVSVKIERSLVFSTFDSPGGGVFQIMKRTPGGELTVLSDIQTLGRYPGNFELIGNLAVIDTDGITVVNISNPNSAWVSGSVILPGPASLVGDLVVDGNMVFVASRGGQYSVGAISVVNIENPNDPRVLSTVQHGGSISEIEMIDDVLIALKHDFGLVTVRVSYVGINPGHSVEAPMMEIIGGLELEDVWGYTDMICVDDLVFVLSVGKVDIVDCSDPENPQLIKRCTLPSGAYSHKMDYYQGYLYAGTPSAGVAVIDVTEPSEAEVVGFINTNSGTRAVAVGQDRLYVSVRPSELQTFPLQCSDFFTSCEIDVKPGSAVNHINCLSHGGGVIPVAIVSSPDFDALTVDHTTVQFGPGQAFEAHSNPHGLIRHEEDVDGDGDLDLLFHFRQTEVGIQCGETQASLTGQTYDGQKVVGADMIQTGGGGEENSELGESIRISPNPFNPCTTVFFSTDQRQQVQVAVYNIRGAMVDKLTDQIFEAGEHSVVWQGRDASGRSVPTGEYFFRVELGGLVETRKVVLIK